jgi:uncharacterized membrane protein
MPECRGNEMKSIYLCFTLAILMLNVAGLTLLASRLLPVVALARAAGILMFCLVMFFIEHFVGLGSLTWVWPVTTLVSAFLLWRYRSRFCDREVWHAELVFLLAFLYGFMWRYAFPDLDAGSEHLSDLYYITNYLSGSTLPPLDRWYPPHMFNFYYAFQHYSAALMARIFGIESGTAYNIAFALLMALPVTLAWYVTSRFIKNRCYRVLLIVALISGGTGFSPLLPLVLDNTGTEPYWASAIRVIGSQRFIGDTEVQAEHRVKTAIGERLFPTLRNEQKPTPNFVQRQLPQETFGYQYFLGDYHPPIGGYFLLMFALALIAAMETGGLGRIGQAFLALSVPAVLITQTWVFPLHGFLLTCWVAYRYWKKDPPDWGVFLTGGLIGFALIYPFLTLFSAHDGGVAIKLVSRIDHTPLDRFMGLHWPLMVLVLLGMMQPATRKISIMFALTFGLLLLISEVFYVDDPSGEQYERTNTTMKWWGWIWVGGLVSLGSVCLGSSARYARWGAAATLVLVSTIAYDEGRYFILNDKVDRGHMEGHYWYTSDSVNRDLFNYLKSAPDGIVLENHYDNAYTNTGIHALFAGKTALLGWVAHLTTWHGEISDVWMLQAQIKAFYKAELPNSLDWLIANNVQYIVWGPVENSKEGHPFLAIKQQIDSRYVWKSFNEGDDTRVGVWVRK